MSATDELRRMLDERGVEWKGYKPNPWTDTTAWDIDASDPRREVEAGFIEFDTGVTLLRFWNATPEQAIDATLGAGTCRRIRGHRSYRTQGGYRIECSECGYGLADRRYRYCPNCGRKVVGE